VTCFGLAKGACIGGNPTIVSGRPGRSLIFEARIKQINAHIEEPPRTIDNEKLQERPSQLAGGVAVSCLRRDQVEVKERNKRVDDACMQPSRVEEDIPPRWAGGLPARRQKCLKSCVFIMI